LHPAIAVTFEFRPFLGLDRDPLAHWHVLRKDFARRRIVEIKWLPLWRMSQGRRVSRRAILGALDRLESARFLFTYRAMIREAPTVTTEVIRSAYLAHFGRKHLLGDKVPEYIFSLDSLISEPGLVRVLIYRDPRDVAASAIKMFERGWGGGALGHRLSTPEGVAATWAEAARLMLKHENRCHLVRYEGLVSNPLDELGSLGRSLGVDPAAFRTGMVQGDRVGKGRRELSEQDIEAIERVAAPEMRALGYELTEAA
jgi:hypothetical protein